MPPPALPLLRFGIEYAEHCGAPSEAIVVRVRVRVIRCGRVWARCGRVRVRCGRVRVRCG